MKIVDDASKIAKETIVGALFETIDRGGDPEKSVRRIFSLIKKLATDEDSIRGIENVESYYTDMPSVHEYINDILLNTNKNCLKKFVKNFLANSMWYGIPKRAKWMKNEDTKIPFVLLLSPSMRCNKHCIGCYAAEYPKNQGLTFEQVDSIVSQARDLGIHFMVILGGEPFFVDYMWKIYEKYSDIEFVPFTNGSLITKEKADQLAKLGNVMPMFSLEGFVEQTDYRRGKGTFDRVMESMDLLKAQGIPFGVSTATGRLNVDVVTSDKFIDMLINKGSRLNWYFIYMPVGEKPDLDNMLTPEQRIELGHRTKKIRTTKPYFTIDFFNDAPYVGGCIAGKYYCHINSEGDVEPCIFAHISTDNIKDKPLIEIFRSGMFKKLRHIQPYNENMLRPCMMIDNPNVIRDVASECHAHPTDPSADAMLHDKDFQQKLEKIAEDFGVVADKAWNEDFGCKGNDEFSKG